MKIRIETRYEKHEIDMEIGDTCELTNKDEKEPFMLMALNNNDHMTIIVNPGKYADALLTLERIKEEWEEAEKKELKN